MTTTNGVSQKNIIIESDIGHDPDDVFAILYLISAGVNIRAITVHKGEPHQLALVRMICKECELDIPVGATLLDVPEPKKFDGGFEGRPIQEYVGFHHKLLTHYGYPHTAKADDYGHRIISDAVEEFPDSEIFIIGPPKNVGEFLARSHFNLGFTGVKSITFQGGFIGYDVHNMPCEHLPKFEGKNTYPSYNPGGAVDDTLMIVRSKDWIKKLKFVSKNVCHTIIYDRAIHNLMKLAPIKNKADEMFLIGMELYLQKHSEKKFHDPCAAVCMMHPEIATWFRGTLYRERENGGWGTRPDPTSNSETIVSIDKEKLWQHLLDKD